MEVIDNVELALINLLYAAADVTDRQGEISDPTQRAILTTLLYHIKVADRALRDGLRVGGVKAFRPGDVAPHARAKDTSHRLCAQRCAPPGIDMWAKVFSTRSFNAGGQDGFLAAPFLRAGPEPS